jgi:hypothetical protein
MNVKKTEMVHPFIFPSKTDRFLRQRHVALLKLQHFAAIFLFFIFILRPLKKNVSHPQGQFWGWLSQPYIYIYMW